MAVRVDVCVELPVCDCVDAELGLVDEVAVTEDVRLDDGDVVGVMLFDGVLVMVEERDWLVV